MPGLVSRGYKELMEDWTGADNISTGVADGILWLNSSDGGDTAFAIVADAQGPIVQGATDTDDNDMVEIGYHLLAWSVQHGKLCMETRMKVSVGAVASVALNIGFNDDVLEDSNTLPVELSGTTFTSNSATWIGVLFDPDITDPNEFVAFWVDDDADTTTAIADLRMTSVAPVLNQWFGVEIELSANPPATVAEGEAGTAGGAVVATITVIQESTGIRATKRFTTSIDRNALLTPHIAFENRDAVAHTVEIDYIYVYQSRSGVA